jgi:hypothetical protein
MRPLPDHESSAVGEPQLGREGGVLEEAEGSAEGGDRGHRVEGTRRSAEAGSMVRTWPSLGHGVASSVVVARPPPDMKTEPNREHGRPLPTLAAVGAGGG